MLWFKRNEGWHHDSERMITPHAHMYFSWGIIVASELNVWMEEASEASHLFFYNMT